MKTENENLFVRVLKRLVLSVFWIVCLPFRLVGTVFGVPIIILFCLYEWAENDRELSRQLEQGIDFIKEDIWGL